MKQILFIILAVFAIGCDKTLLGDDEPIISLEENLRSPIATGDGWEVSTLMAENIKPAPIQNLIKDIQADPKNIHSMLIFRNNKLVSESYFDGWHRDRLHALRSDSKSFISTLIGIAIDKGQIKDVDQKVFDFFPEYAYLKNATNEGMQLKHLLTMTAGFDWNENALFLDKSQYDDYIIETKDDRIGYILKKPIATSAGSHFLYNSGLPILQTAIIKKVTGETADVYAKKYLFDPLNITNFYWRMNADGYIKTAPLYLRPRDMAKLGQLFLDGGKWKGNQIVSNNWVTTASSTIISNASIFSGDNNTGYGYNWWTEKIVVSSNTISTFVAEGKGGQYIFVVPSLNAVVVFTGGNYDIYQSAPFGLMQNVILPAMM
jgi:CubicO group peptidase (beta-lactamase class C family)